MACLLALIVTGKVTLFAWALDAMPPATTRTLVAKVTVFRRFMIATPVGPTRRIDDYLPQGKPTHGRRQVKKAQFGLDFTTGRLGCQDCAAPHSAHPRSRGDERLSGPRERCLHPLDDDRRSHAAGGAHGDEAALEVAALQFVQDGADQHRAGGADRVAE